MEDAHSLDRRKIPKAPPVSADGYAAGVAGEASGDHGDLCFFGVFDGHGVSFMPE